MNYSSSGGKTSKLLYRPVGESWGMANDGEWRTGQYLVEGVKVIFFTLAC